MNLMRSAAPTAVMTQEQPALLLPATLIQDERPFNPHTHMCDQDGPDHSWMVHHTSVTCACLLHERKAANLCIKCDIKGLSTK